MRTALFVLPLITAFASCAFDEGSERDGETGELASPSLADSPKLGTKTTDCPCHDGWETENSEPGQPGSATFDQTIEAGWVRYDGDTNVLSALLGRYDENSREYGAAMQRWYGNVNATIQNSLDKMAERDFAGKHDLMRAQNWEVPPEFHDNHGRDLLVQMTIVIRRKTESRNADLSDGEFLELAFNLAVLEELNARYGGDGETETRISMIVQGLREFYGISQ